MATAQISQPLAGDKLYQVRARRAMPILVRQAEAGHTISYADLAEELGMPNPRNLNFVLGSIGKTLQQLSRAKKQQIPPIQCLVVNGISGLPGEGIGWFLIKKDNYKALPPEKKRAVVRAHLSSVFGYPYWDDVLKDVGLERPAGTALPALPAFGYGGEGPEHKALKEFVAKHPELVGLAPRARHGETEACLLSGDAVDVSFRHDRLWLAAEIKSHISSEMDVQRGLFQCVKYRAVMAAQALALGIPQDTRVVLVLGGRLPPKLQALKNTLGIDVIEGVRPE